MTKDKVIEIIDDMINDNNTRNTYEMARAIANKLEREGIIKFNVVQFASTGTSTPPMNTAAFDARYGGYPERNGQKCPDCGSELWDTTPNVILTSMPAQKNTHCDCGYKGYRRI